MIERKVAGNKVLITASRCGIEITQKRTGRIMIKLSGRDDGELGRIPFDELDHLLAAHPKTELFIDTSAATGVSLEVTDQWKNWLADRRNSLSLVHILTTETFFLVAASIMRELSQTRDKIHIYSSATDFRQALETDRVNTRETNDQKFTVFRESSFSGDEMFSGKKSRIHVLRLRPGVLFVRIAGFDSGDTTAAVLGALSNEVENYPGKTHLFVEAAKTTGLLASVSEEWTRWIHDHHAKIQQIFVLSDNRLVTLIVSAAKIFSKTGELITIVDQEKEFYTHLEKVSPGGSALSCEKLTSDQTAGASKTIYRGRLVRLSEHPCYIPSA